MNGNGFNSVVRNPSAIVLGDLDGDGEVTDKDDRFFKDYFAGRER